jgi:hypothetical protein
MTLAAPPAGVLLSERFTTMEHTSLNPEEIQS